MQNKNTLASHQASTNLDLELLVGFSYGQMSALVLSHPLELDLELLALVLGGFEQALLPRGL